MKATIRFEPELQLLQTYRTAEDIPVFENLDLRVAELASEHLPDNLLPQQAKLAVLLFACCHQQSSAGHFLFRTKELPKLLNRAEVDFPFEEVLKTTFAALPESFRSAPSNPIYWESPEIMYVRRYWKIETDTAAQIARFAHRMTGDETKNTWVNRPSIDDPALPSSMTSQQVTAALAPLHHPLVLISGGPGTGKTYTVFQTIRMIHSRHPHAKIQLLAPTGKAVARMQESIRKGLSAQAATDKRPPLLEIIDAATIHRFLKHRESNQDRYRAFPKPTESLGFVIVDEASMIDLALLNRLIHALDSETHLILMGDIHQLASVQPGAAFADVFEVCTQTNLGIPTIQLSGHFRFKDNPALGDLCEAIRVGDSKQTLHLLESSPPASSIQLIDPKDASTINDILSQWIKDHILPQVACDNPDIALAGYSRSFLLCVQNEGPYGVTTINQSISNACERFLRTHSPDAHGHRAHYWKPVMISKNDYALKLFNGDMGIIQHFSHAGPSASKAAMACFQAVDGSIINCAQPMLPHHRDAFAFTVHKSQGSEADHVLLLLPDRVNPTLTRELLYTAVSRAKRQLTIIGKPEIIVHATTHTTTRESQLQSRIQRLLS